jgi:hypothetical protein
VSASDFSRWVETAKSLCEILAIFAGGAWTYLNYFRGRLHKRRLECSVEASVEKHSGRSFLKVVVRMRNIGLSKVPIQQTGTALLIYSVDNARSHSNVPEPGSMERASGGVRCILGQ